MIPGKSDRKSVVGKRSVVLFWHSDPVRPDEAVLAMGAGITSKTVVEIARLEDAPPGRPAQGEPRIDAWIKVPAIQPCAESLKFVVPAKLKSGVFAGRLNTDGNLSNVFYLNAPDPWWLQGDAGFNATAGGWLRVFGKCLNFGGITQVALVAASDAEAHVLSPKAASLYAVEVDMPASLKAGAYQVWVHNGLGGSTQWRKAGALCVDAATRKERPVLDVRAFGVVGDGVTDCTPGIMGALERLGGMGGGVLFFPRGRYRIDSGMCTGRFSTPSPLTIPPGVILRGEKMELVSLWWPDRETPLPSLIQGGNDFGVEELTIYTQGRHRNVITGFSNVRVSRVRIRASCGYMQLGYGQEFHGRRLDEQHASMGSAIELWGENAQVTDCDILHSNWAITLKHVRGGLIARNTINYGGNYLLLYGGERIIFENNQCAGVNLMAAGGFVSTYFEANTCRHVYFAHNTISQVYGCDREAMTLDGHGTAYLGKVASVQGTRMTLAADPHWGGKGKDAMPNWQGSWVFIVSGRGAGQYRLLTDCAGRRVEMETPWMVEPDSSSSRLMLGKLNGRHLFIENTMMDAGSTIQLYPPNCECIVAGNKGIRAGNFNSGGVRGGELRVEPSWFNQFLDNVIEEGNGWGGVTGNIDAWLGGEAIMNIYGLVLQAEECWPISRGQILRRNRLRNNSSIRIRGAVADAVVENCHIADNETGIHVSSESRTASAGAQDACGHPERILLRKNLFERVHAGIVAENTNDVFIA